MARKPKIEIPHGGVPFSVTMLQSLALNMRNGNIRKERLIVSDDICQGLRAIIRKSGAVSLHAHYEHGDSRPMLKLGELDEITIAEARALTRTIRALAEKGIDPLEDLRKKLMAELLEKGVRWKP